MPKRKRAKASKSRFVSGSPPSGGSTVTEGSSSMRPDLLPPWEENIVLRYFLQHDARSGAIGKAALRRLVVLSDREQRVLDELERNYDAEAAPPPPRPGPRPGSRPGSRTGPRTGPRPRRGRWRRRARGRDPLPAVVAVVVGGWISLLLLIAGAPAGAVGIATTVGLGWL